MSELHTLNELQMLAIFLLGVAIGILICAVAERSTRNARGGKRK